MLWVPTRIVLGEHARTVDEHIEDAAAAFDQVARYTHCLLDLGRQTGGPRKVVSTDAVMDLDLHDGTSRRSACQGSEASPAASYLRTKRDTATKYSAE